MIVYKVCIVQFCTADFVKLEISDVRIVKQITMDNYTMIMPNYSIGDDVYSKIGEFCSGYGKKAVMIGGKTALSKAEKAVKENSEGVVEFTGTLWYGGESSYENVQALMEKDEVKSADMIFAVGGGKALDTCKCLADKTGKPVFTFPTIASNCACCTSVSIMYKPDGTFIEPYFFLSPAVHSFINTKILCEAPAEFLWAGMGDTYAKHYEATISSRGEEVEHFKAFGVAMSSMCVDPIIRYGKKALEDNKAGICSFEFKETVLAICVTTGFVSIFVTRDHTPDYNSGLAHAVFYTLTSIGIEEKHLHGEVVGFGVLICLLVDGQTEEYKRIRDFNKSVGLPVKLADIEVTRDQFDGLLETITTMSDIRHYPYKVTVEMLEKAINVIENENV